MSKKKRLGSKVPTRPKLRLRRKPRRTSIGQLSPKKVRKNAEFALTSFEKQAQKQRDLLKVVEEQLAISQENINVLKKRLEGKQEELEKAKQSAYDLGKKETF